jgi:hypothetical protein
MKFTFLLFLIFSSFFQPNNLIHERNHEPLMDYLQAKGPFVFDSDAYELKWSSNPQKGYYKEEFLRKKDNYPDFNRMLLLEYIAGVKPAGAMNAKAGELETLKKNNPVINYETIKSPDGKQFIIDFIISSGAIYEWNVYKFTSYKKGTELLGFCLHSTKKGELPPADFFAYVKKNRADLINKMIETPVPVINLK